MSRTLILAHLDHPRLHGPILGWSSWKRFPSTSCPSLYPPVRGLLFCQDSCPQTYLSSEYYYWWIIFSNGWTYIFLLRYHIFMQKPVLQIIYFYVFLLWFQGFMGILFLGGCVILVLLLSCWLVCNFFIFFNILVCLCFVFREFLSTVRQSSSDGSNNLNVVIIQ